jgi:hypothetical protein
LYNRKPKVAASILKVNIDKLRIEVLKIVEFEFELSIIEYKDDELTGTGFGAGYDL